MSVLDGADPEGLEPVPEVHPLQLNTMSCPGSWDGLQGLDFIKFRWQVEMETIVGQGHEVSSVEKPHKAQ